MPDSSQNDELYTVFENTSSVRRTFSDIGKTLAAGEVIAIPGDVMNALGSKRDPRQFNGLKRALARGKGDSGGLVIRNRPMPMLYDYEGEKPFGLAVSNGALGLVDPTYTSESSDSFAEV